MRITDATPQAEPAASPERTEILRQARAVEASVAEAVSSLTTPTQGRDGLVAAQGPLSPMVQDALDRAGLLSGPEPQAATGPRESIADMAVEIALGIADAVRRGDQGGAESVSGHLDALPLPAPAQAAMDRLVEATLQVLEAAEQGDYRDAGAAYRSSFGALEAALGAPSREPAPQREERIISVAA